MTAADQRNAAFCAGCQRYVPLQGGKYVTHGPGADGEMTCSGSRQKVPEVLVEAEPLRIVSVVGKGDEAIVLTSDHVVFQPPDAEARAQAYVDRARELVEAKDLLRELLLTFSSDTVRPEDFAIIPAVRTWLRLHGGAV